MGAFNQRPLIQHLDDLRHAPVGAVVPLEQTGTGLAMFGPQEQPEPEPEPLITEVSLISQLAAIDSPRAASLLVELTALTRACQALIEEHNTQQHTELENQHRAIRKQGRAALEQVTQLRDKLMAAEIGARDALVAQDKAIRALENLSIAERQKTHLSRWASDAEVAAWNQRVQRARNHVGQANQALVEAQNVHRAAQTQVDTATMELHRLGAEETRLRNRLEGKPYTDPEYGLEVKP